MLCALAVLDLIATRVCFALAVAILRAMSVNKINADSINNLLTYSSVFFSLSYAFVSESPCV